MKLNWQVTQLQNGQRLDRVLRKEYGLSRRQVVRLKQQPGAITINGNPAPAVQILAWGQQVEVSLAEHLSPLPPEDIALDIIYEDKHVLVLDKAAGLVSHPTKGYADGTLANALSHHWLQQGEPRPARLVTRLDRETSGLVLVAKSAWSHHRLSHRPMEKEYLALTQGIPDPPQGQITAPIGRVGSRRGVTPQGKSALTKYSTVEVRSDIALVSLWPLTGRTHQLRIHMATIGCPLVDDFMYGSQQGVVGRTALHAYRLKFCHPATGKELSFCTPLPRDMAVR